MSVLLAAAKSCVRNNDGRYVLFRSRVHSSLGLQFILRTPWASTSYLRRNKGWIGPSRLFGPASPEILACGNTVCCLSRGEGVLGLVETDPCSGIFTSHVAQLGDSDCGESDRN